MSFISMVWKIAHNLNVAWIESENELKINSFNKRDICINDNNLIKEFKVFQRARII